MSPLSPTFTLSPGQRAIWFAQQTNPTSTEYQCAELLTFDTTLDVEVLSQVIADCLETLPVFQAHYAGPHEATAWPHRITVERCDTVAGDVQQWAAQRITEVADPALRGDTLTKHWLATLPDGTVVWLARFHHITGDGFAINALLSWLGEAYTAHVAGKPLPENHLTCDYSTISDSEPTQEVADYWAHAGVSAPESIMSAQPADDEMVLASAVISTAGRAKLRTIHPVEMETLATVAAFYVSAFSSPDTATVTLGMPLMNRPLGQSQVALTPMVSVLPLVVPVSSEQPMTIPEVAQAFRGLRTHAAIRTDQLRQVLGVTDPHQHVVGPHVNIRPFTPEFQFGSAVARLTTISVGPINDCELVFQSLPDGGLEIIVMARGSNLRLDVHRHANRLAHLIRKIAEQGNFDSVSVATTAELAEIAAANDTAHELPARSLPELIEFNRTRTPMDVLALGIWYDSKISSGQGPRGTFAWRTWAQVWTAVDDRVAVLRDLGLGPGHVVAVHLERSEEFLLTVAATASLGIAWCPIDPDLPPDRKVHMVATSNAAAVVTLTPVADTVVDDATTGITTIDAANWRVTRRAEIPAAGDPECAYILFTSGSTGTPKAVGVSQVGIANRLEWMRDYYILGPFDRVLHKTPSSFDVSVWEYLLPFTNGISTAIASPQAHRNPEEILAHLRVGKISVCHFVPSALKAFLTYASYADNQPDLPKLRMVITSGEALDSGVAQRCRTLLGVAVHNLYGPTEAAIDVTAHTVTDADRIIPIGAPVWNTRIYVVDRYGQPVPPGVPGTLLIAGCQVALSYVGQPELTAQRFRPDPDYPGEQIYDSGDRALWHGGELYYLGRSDGQVKLRGQRLELGEVESAVATVHGVAQAAVAVKEVGGDKALVAYCVPTPGADPQAISEEVLTATKAVLPAFMVPSFVLVVPELPMTRNGKLDASALPSPTPQAVSTVADATPAERRVLQAFSEVLGTPVADVDANFFALGGSSLSAVTVAVALDGVHIADVFAHPTARSLAQLVDAPSAGDAGFAEVITLHEHHGGTPVLCFYPAGGLSWSYTTLVRMLADRKYPGGVFGFQAPGILDESERATSITDSAARICEHVIGSMGFSRVALVGWSVGGVLAHEVATQLTQRGIKVEHVIVLDAYPATVWQQLPAPDDRRLWQGVLAMAGISADRELTPDEVVAAMQSRGGVFAELPPTALDGIRTMVKHNAYLMRDHHTSHYPGKLIHVTAAAELPERDPRLVASAWEPHVGTLTSYHANVRHPGMVSPEVLSQVAAIISGAPTTW